VPWTVLKFIATYVDGVVWLQGTNAIEETAYFLSLTVQSASGVDLAVEGHNGEKPIVVTGAQRPYNGLSTDGPMNLLDAIRLSGPPETRGKGAVVAFNGEINAARDVTKTNTYHPQTFRTRDLAQLTNLSHALVSRVVSQATTGRSLGQT
jgi:L-asparaginase